MQGDWLGGIARSVNVGANSFLEVVGIGNEDKKPPQASAPTRQPPKAGEDILGTLTTGLRKRVNLVASPADKLHRSINQSELSSDKILEPTTELVTGVFSAITGFYLPTQQTSAPASAHASPSEDHTKPQLPLFSASPPSSSSTVNALKYQFTSTPAPAPIRTTSTESAALSSEPPEDKNTTPSDDKERDGPPPPPPRSSLQEAKDALGNPPVTAELFMGKSEFRGESPSLGVGPVFYKKIQTSGVGFGNTTISEASNGKPPTPAPQPIEPPTDPALPPAPVSQTDHEPPPAPASAPTPAPQPDPAPQPPAPAQPPASAQPPAPALPPHASPTPEPKPVAPPLPAPPPPEPLTPAPQPDPASPPAPAPRTEAESPLAPAQPPAPASRPDSAMPPPAPASDSTPESTAEDKSNALRDHRFVRRTASGAADVKTLEEETPNQLQIIDQNKFNKIFLTPDASNQPESDKISKLFDQTFPNRESPQSGEETATSNDSQFIIAQSDDNKFRLFHQFRGANAQHLTHETIKFEDHRDSGLMAMLFIMNEVSFKDENGIYKIQEDQIVDFNSVKFLPENTLKTALKKVITEISTETNSEKISDELKDRLLKEVDRNLGHDIGDTAGNFVADASGLAKDGVDLAGDILKSVGGAVGLKSEDKSSTNQGKDSKRPLEFLAPEKTTIDELRQIAKALESSGKISYSQDTKLASDEPSKKEDNVTKSETNLNQQILDLNTANPPEFDDFKKKVCGFLNQDTMPEDPSNHYNIIKEISEDLIKKNDSDKFLSTKQISTLETFREIADSFLIAEDGKKPKPETFKKLSQFFDYPEDKTSHFYDKHFDNLSNDELKMVVIPPEYHPKPVGKAKKFGIEVSINQDGIVVDGFKNEASQEVKQLIVGDKITSIKYKDINGKETEEQISGLWKKYEDKGLDPVFMITMMIGELSEKGDLTFVTSKSTEEGAGVNEATEEIKKDVTLNKKNKTEIDFRTKQGKEIDSPTSKKNTLEGVKSDNTNSRDNSKSPSNFVERFSGPNGNGAGRSL